MSSPAHSLECQPAEDRCARGGGRGTQCLGLCGGGVPDLGREQRLEVIKARSADLQRPEWGLSGLSSVQKAEKAWSKSCGKFLGPGLPH